MALATLMTTGLVVSQAVTAAGSCFPAGAGYYCDLDHSVSSILNACHVACALSPLPTLNTTGTGSVSGDGSFSAGTIVNLVATPATNSTFAGCQAVVVAR